MHPSLPRQDLPAPGHGSPTLVIPAYNRGALIEDTLRSAVRQTRPFAEIIVVDDGSTDDTAARVERFAAQRPDGRIRLIRTRNQGVQAARNTGVRAAGTELVALCDSDDLLEPAYCATVTGWMESHPGTDILYCNFTPFDENGDHPDKFSGAPSGFFDGAVRTGNFLECVPDLYRRSLSYQPLFPTGLVTRAAFYRAIGGYDTAFNGVGAEDWEFTLRAIAHGRVALCAASLIRIRKHAGNDSRDSMRMAIGEALILEHGLAHHPGAATAEPVIRQSILKRRHGAFDAAFARGDFGIAKDMLRLLGSPASSAKFRLKRFIVDTPGFARHLLWKLSQQLTA
ncbi:MAG: glycosyltransferase family 2 protein [Xylophilus ampelinus]